MIVITKIDQVDEQELDQLKNEIAEKNFGCCSGTRFIYIFYTIKK